MAIQNKGNELVIMNNGKMTVTSLELVEQINFFRVQEEKPKTTHDSLLKIIRDEFENEISLGELNEREYKNTRNQKQPMYILTTLQAKQLLARESKFVRKALLLYIEKLEELIREKLSAHWQDARLKGKAIRTQETDTIRDKLIPLATEQGSTNYSKFYMSYSKLVNSILKISSDDRDNLPYHYLRTIELLERIIENIISAEVDKGTHYKEIYQVCKAKCQIAADLSFLPKLEPLVKAGPKLALGA